MARDTDRKHVSEAFRTQPLINGRTTPLWKRDCYGALDYGNGGSYVAFITEYAERLVVRYGPSGRIIEVTYVHYDENGRVADHKDIPTRKRETVLHLLKTGRML